MTTRKVNLTIALKHKPKKGTNPLWNLVIKGIQFRTNSKYYHSELIIDDKWLSAYPEKGIAMHDLRPTLNKDEWLYIPLGKHTVTEKQYLEIMEFINEVVGSRYDFMGIFFSQFIKVGIDNKHKWFCSEIVSKILQLFLVKEYVDKVPHDLAPGDLYRLSKYRFS